MINMKLVLTTWIALFWSPQEAYGTLYHSPLDQCVPPLILTEAVATYATISPLICAFLCKKQGCLAFEFTEENGCLIYGQGLEPNASTYIDTGYAAPALGGSLREAAKGNTALAIGDNANAYKVVDDDMLTRWATGGQYQWLMVDLVRSYYIHKVTILPRSGYYAYRFKKVEIRAGPSYRDDGNLTTWEFIGYYPGTYSGAQGRLSYEVAEGVCGRFVSVQRIDPMTEAFTFNDIEIFVRQ